MDPYRLHVGDDYLEVITPDGKLLTMRYPNREDVGNASDMVELLNTVRFINRKIKAASTPENSRYKPDIGRYSAEQSRFEKRIGQTVDATAFDHAWYSELHDPEVLPMEPDVRLDNFVRWYNEGLPHGVARASVAYRLARMWCGGLKHDDEYVKG